MNARDMEQGRKGEARKDSTPGVLGAHPVGTGLGAAAGAAAGGMAAGALAGSAAGPVGTIVGATVGAVAGGLAGKGIAESIDPKAEEGYWREHYSSRPYVKGGSTFDDYGPAYGFGVDSYRRFNGRSFDQVEPDLKREWNRSKGASTLSWDSAKAATRDAWQRLSDTIERAVPGDSDRDGK